jgi:WD40 repeat protein
VLAYSPDGSRLAYGREDWSGYSGRLSVHVLTTSDSGARQIAVLPSRYGVAGLALGPNGRLLVGGTCVKLRSNVECARGAIEVWDLVSHRRRLVKVGRSGAVDWVAVTPAGGVVARAGGAIFLWEPGSQRPRKVIELPRARLDAVALSPDGKTLAASGCGMAGSKSAGDLNAGYYTTTDCVQGRIDFWNLEDGTPIGRPVSAHTDTITSLTFAPDGRTVYSAAGEFDGSIRAWDSRSHRERERPLSASVGTVSGLAASPDGKLLASTSLESGTTIWDLASGERLTDELPDSAGAASIVFDPRESTLVAVSGGVLGWRLSLPALASEACGIANRNLSRSEWESDLSGEPYAQTCPGLPDAA